LKATQKQEKETAEVERKKTAAAIKKVEKEKNKSVKTVAKGSGKKPAKEPAELTPKKEKGGADKTGAEEGRDSDGRGSAGRRKRKLEEELEEELSLAR
jgi:hypothetical protein